MDLCGKLKKKLVNNNNSEKLQVLVEEETCGQKSLKKRERFGARITGEECFDERNRERSPDIHLNIVLGSSGSGCLAQVVIVRE